MLTSLPSEFNDDGLFFYGYSHQLVNFCKLFLIRECYKTYGTDVGVNVEFQDMYKAITVYWYTHHLSYLPDDSYLKRIKIPPPPQKKDLYQAVTWAKKYGILKDNNQHKKMFLWGRLWR